MKQKLLDRLIHWPRPNLTRTEIAVLVGRSADACDAVIRRAIQADYLKRLRRGLYLITPKVGADKPDPREIAQLMYGPSYISFESALSWHGWIPEGVRVITSATTKRKKEFRSPIGTFSYEPVPSAAFSIGVRRVQTEKGAFLIADGWKALADLIYVRKCDWFSVGDISEDLRIEPEDLANSDLPTLKTLSEHYPDRRTRHHLKRYYRELVK